MLLRMLISGKCLYLSGLIPEPMNASDDYRLKEIGIGFTNFVSRCSKGSVELTRFVVVEFRDVPDRGFHYPAGTG